MIEKGIDMKALGFDLDDTIYNRLTIYEQTFDLMQVEGREAGYAVDVDFATFNHIYAQFSESEYQAFMAGKKTEVAFKNDRVILTYAHFGKEIDEDLAKKFNQAKNDFQHKLTLSDELVALMEAAMVSGQHLFVLTNGSTKAQIDKLSSLGMEKYIPQERWYISEAMGVSKPHKAAFDQIARDLQVDPHDILFVGDDYANDVEGAINAGWQAIHFAKEERENTVATCTTDDFLEIRTLITGL
jgi:putative hydrolase of the HAD superfamily